LQTTNAKVIGTKDELQSCHGSESLEIIGTRCASPNIDTSSIKSTAATKPPDGCLAARQSNYERPRINLRAAEEHPILKRRLQIVSESEERSTMLE
jgi:hypothetical protein